MQTKQLILSLIAFVAILLSSCSDEQAGIGTGSGGTQTLSFRLTTEEQAQTRAGSGAPTAPSGYKLMYHAQILDAAGETITGSNSSNDQGKFTFNLPVGTSYTCLFWAHYVASSGGTESAYFNASDLKAVTLKQHLTGDDECQAFCGTADVTVATGTTPPATTTVTLKRAVAQVNIKSDTKLTGYSKLEVAYTDVCNTFNVANNEVSKTADSNVNGSEPATITVSTFPTNPDTGGSQYTCQSAYFLAPTGATAGVLRHLLGIEVKTYNAGTNALIQTLGIANVPTEKNFKTNVVVNFDPASVTHQYTMNVDEWESTDIEHRLPSVWDGTPATGSSTGSTFTSGAGTSSADPYILASAADFAQLAADVNAGCTYENKYFKLTVDIDLNNKAWTPIGSEAQKFSCKNFDGDFHTISNLKINSNLKDIGLFGYIYHIGYQPRVEKLHVQGDVVSTYSTNGDGSAGGICGRLRGIILSCSFSGSVSNPNGLAGGLLGNDNGSNLFASKNTASVSGRAAGGLSGGPISQAIACYNTGSVTGTAQAGGLITTPPGNMYSVKGSYNIGTVSCSTSACGALIPNIDNDIISGDCYVTVSYNVVSSNEKVFGASTWPSNSTIGDAWFADPTNDGTYTESGGTFTNCKFWKSLGSYNGGTNPEYPKLWWEN